MIVKRRWNLSWYWRNVSLRRRKPNIVEKLGMGLSSEKCNIKIPFEQSAHNGLFRFYTLYTIWFVIALQFSISFNLSTHKVQTYRNVVTRYDIGTTQSSQLLCGCVFKSSVDIITNWRWWYGSLIELISFWRFYIILTVTVTGVNQGLQNHI